MGNIVRPFLVCGLVLNSVVAVCAAEGRAAIVRSGALSLHWSETGRVVGIDVGGDDITGRGVSLSGFALRDCAVHDTYEPLSGMVTTLSDGVRFESQNRAGTLAVSADCVPQNDWFLIRGKVRNLTEQDHAVSLRFALPISCAGWKWAARLHRNEPLLAGKNVYLGKATAVGTGHMALRPVAAISDDCHTVGLSLPVDFIGQYDFSVDVDREVFSLVFDFSMTRYSPRFFKSVTFEFYVAGEADGWGLRSVLDRYYANRPEFFAPPTSDAGGWFAWGDILRQPPPVCDYGMKFHEQPESEEGYRHDEALGIRVYPYVEPFMYQMCLGDQPADKRPTREFALQRLEEWAKPETTGRLPSGGFRTQEALQRICQAIHRHGVHDAKGEPIIGAIGQYNWISGTKWAAQFPLDLTPGVPDGAGQDRLAHVRTHLLNRPYLSGIYLDSMANHLSRVYYPKENLQYSSYPPLFDGRTFEPCSMVAFAAWEWVDALWNMLPPDKRELLPNLYGQSVPLPWHRFVVMGKEHWIEPAGPLMQQYRTMGYRKVVTQLPAYEDRDGRFLRNLMLLGVFPGGYARRSTDPPQGMRAAYRVVIPLLRQLHRLGWEPIPHATSTSGAVIERYGVSPGPIVFAVHDPYEADIVHVRVDAGALGLPPDALVVDVVDQRPVEYSYKDGAFDVDVGLEGNSTTLLLVGGSRAYSKWLRMLADDRLDDVRLCLEEYALRHNVGAHPASPDATLLNSQSDPAELVEFSQRIAGHAPTEVRARELMELASECIQNARAPKRSPSRKAEMPQSDIVLPWNEPFDRLSPDQWHPPQVNGIRVAGGRLELELPRDATQAEIHTARSWPFVRRALVIESDFKYSHGDHDRYLRLSMKISGSPDRSDEYLLVRIDGNSRQSVSARVENHNAPATNWKHTLSPWHRFNPNSVHHLRLRLEKDKYRLELDDQLVGEGAHECCFGWAHLVLGVYSGHRGHGDVCWWDDLKVYRAP